MVAGIKGWNFVLHYVKHSRPCWPYWCYRWLSWLFFNQSAFILRVNRTLMIDTWWWYNLINFSYTPRAKGLIEMKFVFCWVNTHHLVFFSSFRSIFWYRFASLFSDAWSSFRTHLWNRRLWFHFSYKIEFSLLISCWLTGVPLVSRWCHFLLNH